MDVTLKSKVYIRWIENHKNAAGVFGLQRGKREYPIDLVSISVADGEPVGLWWCRIYFGDLAWRRTDMRANLREVDGKTAEGVKWWYRAGSLEFWALEEGRDEYGGGDQGTRRCRSSNALRINFPSSR